MKFTVSLVLLLATIVAAPCAHAQSLADLARREANRRQTVDRPGRVFTNADLHPVPTTSTPPATGPIKALTAEALLEPDVTPTPDTTVETNFDDRGEEYWRAKAVALRQRLWRASEDQAALTAHAASLGNGTAADRAERGLTLDALRTAEADSRALHVEWVGLENQARIVKVPAAWLRPDATGSRRRATATAPGARSNRDRQ